MAILLVPLLVVALAVIVLVADLVPAGGTSRGLGALTAIGLFAAFVATWFVPSGVAYAAYSNDGFTEAVQRIVLAAGALSALASIDHADEHFPRRQGEYYLLLITSIFGMTLLAGARELVTLLVAFETMGIPQYVLAAMHKNRKTGIEGAVKLYLTGAISAGITMYGASFLVGTAGSTQLAVIAATPPDAMLAFGALLVLAGMGFKLGVVPFHMWVPDVYQSAPAPFVAFLSVAPKAAAVAALVRIAAHAGSSLPGLWAPVVIVLAVITLTVGNLFALPQTNVRRLLAWSGIGHAGFLLIAFAIGTAEAYAAALFYLATYVAGNTGAFFVSEAVGSKVGDEVSGWNGLARRSPGLALAMLLCLLSLGGIPFVAGFWGKLLLFRTTWNAGYHSLVVYGALLSVVGLFYYLKVARAMYVEPAVDPSPIPVGRPTMVAIVLAVAAVVGLGVAPGGFWDAAVQAGTGVELLERPQLAIPEAGSPAVLGDFPLRKEKGARPRQADPGVEGFPFK
ncbi:NADH-quinone oxidoreductase subunit N [Deltaproteobacteria bacterium]|nr:NADH-quinone oxidoreductase subunit N [Deltaproteobacteria bacterium]